MNLIDLIESLIALEKRHGGDTPTNVQAVYMEGNVVHVATALESKPMPEVPELEGRL